MATKKAKSGMKQLLDTLNTFDFNKWDDKKLIGDRVSVSYRVVMATSVRDIETMPLQIVIRVEYDGHHCLTWGCENQQDHVLFTRWYVLAMAKTQEQYLKNNRDSEEIAYVDFMTHYNAQNS